MDMGVRTVHGIGVRQRSRGGTWSTAVQPPPVSGPMRAEFARPWPTGAYLATGGAVTSMPPCAFHW
jgi:hypothetical protein